MHNFQRIYQLHRILASRRLPLSHKDLEALMECSRATVTRTIDALRDYFNAPLKYDREHTAITTHPRKTAYSNCPVFGSMLTNCTRC